jgi:hypothetical protein
MKHHSAYKPFLILLLYVLVVTDSYAQDTLYRADGRIQVVNLEEVNFRQVKYRKLNSNDGLLFIVNRSEIVKIIYKNGDPNIHLKSDDSSQFVKRNLDHWDDKEAKIDPLSKSFKRKYINISLTDLIAESLTIGFEVFNKKGDFSIRVPISIGLYYLGLNDYTNKEYEKMDLQVYYRERKLFSSGLDVYFYPNGQGKMRYYLGPSIEFGRFKYIDKISGSSTNPKAYEEEQLGTFSSILIHNGILFQPTASINFNMALGIGYSRPDFFHSNNSYTNGSTEFAARLVFNAGYKF